MFRTDYKKFYHLLRQKNTNVKNTSNKEEIENFWKQMYWQKVEHNEEADWMKKACQQIKVTTALKQMLAKFWLKPLTVTHKCLADF